MVTGKVTGKCCRIRSVEKNDNDNALSWLVVANSEMLEIRVVNQSH